MKQKIKKAAVLGAGVMGSTIAAHLANVWIRSFLRDIVPPELAEAEKKKGLTFNHPEVRNRFSVSGKKRAQELSPAAFYLKDDAELLTIGNFEDHLSWVSQADWIIEVVLEDLNIKRELFKKLMPFLKEGTVVSSNTSGISINKMSEGFSRDVEEMFLGTHFFNPPRYMKLLEIIPGKTTSKSIVDKMVDVGEKILGNGVIFAKDTPNFIATRIGAFAMTTVIKTMVEDGYRIEEVDQITGPAMGRPKSATFRTADMVGLDVMAHVTKNLLENLPEKERAYFQPPSFLQQMVKNQWLGQKKKPGLYKRVKGEGKEETLVLDYEKLDYRAQTKASFPSVEAAKNIEDLGERIKTLVMSPDRGGQFAWKTLKKTILYSAEKIPEISDDIVNIDRAMRWGYNWELGPFEIWDAIGLKSSVKRMEKEGETVPPLVERLLGKGYSSFYEKKEGPLSYFDLGARQYREVEEK